MSGERREPAIALALGSSPWESEFVAALVAKFSGSTIRRCVDVVDLAACIDSTRPDLVVVDDRFPRLDVSTVSRISQTQSVLVGICVDKEGAARLKNLGIHEVIPVDTGGIVEAAAAIGQLRPASAALAGDTAPSTTGRDSSRFSGSHNPSRTGRVTVVWGPPGGVGRTHIAVGVAQLLAEAGRSVLLADADSTCAGIGPAFCLTHEGSGMIAAAHHADRGTLDPAVLARLARAITDKLRVLTGLPHIRRRAELRAAPMSRLWSVATQLTDDVIVDIGGCLDDGSLALDGDVGDFGITAGGNSAAVTALAVADDVIAVCSCEPASVARMISHVGAISSLAPAAQLHIVVNRVRSPVVGSNAAQAELVEFIRSQTGTANVHVVVEDRAGTDAAVAAGLTLFEASPKSPAISGLAYVASALAAGRVPVAASA